jgi:hypothetical protein
VSKVDDAAVHDLLRFVFLQFIDHGHDPAVLLHEARIISMPPSRI